MQWSSSERNNNAHYYLISIGKTLLTGGKELLNPIAMFEQNVWLLIAAVLLVLLPQDGKAACAQKLATLPIVERCGDFGKAEERIITNSAVVLKTCEYAQNFDSLSKGKPSSFEAVLLEFYQALFTKNRKAVERRLEGEYRKQLDIFFQQFDLLVKKGSVFEQTQLVASVETPEGVTFSLNFRDRAGNIVMGPLFNGFRRGKAGEFMYGFPDGVTHELFLENQKKPGSSTAVKIDRFSHKLELSPNGTFHFNALYKGSERFKELELFFRELVKDLKASNLDSFFRRVGPLEGWKKAFSQDKEQIPLTVLSYEKLKVTSVIDIDPLLIAYMSSDGKSISRIMRFRRVKQSFVLINENAFNLPYKVFNLPALRAAALENPSFSSLQEKSQ